MSAVSFSLHPEPSDDALVDEAVATHGTRIGLDGLLERRGTRAWRALVRGAAAIDGFRWSLRDVFDRTWWPQGIDLGSHGEHGVDGERRVLVTSWYAQERRGVSMGVRLSFVDLRDVRRPRYHHVLLVEPVRVASGATVRLDPVKIHAGGIGWVGDSIVVADTFGGFRTFRLSDLFVARTAPFGYEVVLPQSSRARVEHGGGGRGMRFSFVSVEHTDGPARLVAGEYGRRDVTSRLARIDPDSPEPLEVHEPGIWHMQGVCIVGGTWYVTSSNGEWERGDLWVGAPGGFVRHKNVLPAGPEDLAYDRTANRLWSLSEWPGRRRVFAIDPARWR